jgi:hypothetical protein
MADGVRTPERVLLRNDANGATVAGMLFARPPGGRDAPFPISSDAAEALAIPAGTPTPVEVLPLPPASDPAPDDGPSDALVP